MGWDSVPWFTGGGAEHSTNVARNVAHAAFDGQEGIINPDACEVRALAIPGTSVRVFPGTVAIKCRAIGILDETYVARMATMDTVDIAPTGAGVPRSDLIIARIENPFLTGEAWPAPADPKVGPYVFTRVIPNVPNTTTSVADLGLSYSAVALARIDIPASTATITQAMITDLRQLPRQQSKTEMVVVSPTVKTTLTAAAFTNFPTEANMTVDCPPWATHARVRVFLAGVGYGSAGGSGFNVFGSIRVQVGTTTNANYSDPTAYNVSNTGGVDRCVLMAGGNAVPVNPVYKGKTIGLRIEGLKGGGTSSIFTDSSSTISLEVEFINKPVSNG